MSAGLAIEGLRSGYGETEVLRDVSLRVARGDALAILGKNGAGKTTLLKTLLGLLPVTAGTLSFNGGLVRGERGLRELRREVGYAPQDNALFTELTVDENLRLGSLTLDRALVEERRKAVVDLFPWLGERLAQRAGSLSGGEQKMLVLARALLPRPAVLLLDEVSEGVQPSVRDRLVAALQAERAGRPLTLIVVEQNIDFAFALEPDFALMERGELTGRGSTREPGAMDAVRRHLEI